MTYPAPLTPADSDLSDFGFMPLEVGRFRRSDLVTQEEPEAIVAAVLLWGAAWHSVPAASLSNDDRSLAQAAGFGRAVDAFRAVKDGAMRGFIECSDGRLYHPVVAEKAREAWEAKLKRLWRTECARIRKANERAREKGLEEDVAQSFEEWRASRYAAAEPDVTRDNAGPSRATRADRHARQGENVTRDTHEAEELIDDGDMPAETLEPQDGQEMPPEDERRVTSHATGGNVTRDNGVDSCARAEKGQGQGQGQGDSNRLRSTTSKGDDDDFPMLEPDPPEIDEPTSIEPEPETETEETPRFLVDRVALLGRKAGINLTRPQTLVKATEQLKAWEEDGFGFETIVLPTIERVTRENPSEPVFSLRYFDPAIRKAAAIAGDPKAKPIKAQPPAAPISTQDGSDPRVAQFRRRLEYHASESLFLYSRDRLAIDVRDDMIELTFRHEGERRGAELDASFTHVRGIAAVMGLALRLRVEG